MSKNEILNELKSYIEFWSSGHTEYSEGRVTSYNHAIELLEKYTKEDD